MIKRVIIWYLKNRTSGSDDTFLFEFIERIEERENSTCELVMNKQHNESDEIIEKNFARLNK